MLHFGIATVDCTPEPGLPLMGNFRDDYAARGVHDPLCAKALVLAEPGGTKVALLAVDVCILDRKNVADIRRSVAVGCDIRPENVLVHATHTHSGPATTTALDFGLDLVPHQPAIDAFLNQASSAIVQANACLAEGSMAVGYAREDRISFNRRLRRHDGTTQMNWEALAPGFDPDKVAGAWGGTDPQVTCLVFQRDGRPVAGLVNFGLHPAILAGDNWLYSADYPGYLSESLRRVFGDEFTCLFFNGCCGNVNHVDYRDPIQGRGYQASQRVGYMLGAAVSKAIRGRAPLEADSLAVSREHVELDRLQVTEQKRRWCETVLDEASRNPPEGQVDGLPDSYYASTLLQMFQKQHQPDSVEVMAARIGPLAMVGLPGECFCELGLEIKQQSPAAHTLVSGLCNDEIGYIPTRESFAQGGYEPLPGSTFYQPGTDARLVESALRQLRRLFD